MVTVPPPDHLLSTGPPQFFDPEPAAAAQQQDDSDASLFLPVSVLLTTRAMRACRLLEAIYSIVKQALFHTVRRHLYKSLQLEVPKAGTCSQSVSDGTVPDL